VSVGDERGDEGWEGSKVEGMKTGKKVQRRGRREEREDRGTEPRRWAEEDQGY